ncbi:hypothetical protein ACFSC4_28875 [Deinococcus malanensis]
MGDEDDADDDAEDGEGKVNALKGCGRWWGQWSWGLLFVRTMVVGTNF